MLLCCVFSCWVVSAQNAVAILSLSASNTNFNVTKQKLGFYAALYAHLVCHTYERTKKKKTNTFGGVNILRLIKLKNIIIANYTYE